MTRKGYYATLPQAEKDRLNAIKRSRYKDPDVRARTLSSGNKFRYGITTDEKDQLFASQGHCCAVCFSKNPGNVHGWHIDHDHETGKVRGILCHPCNVTIGQAKERVTRLLACADYLRRHTSD